MKNDWALSDKSLVKLIPDLSKLSATVAGAEIALDFKQRLREDPTALQTITTAYLKLSIKAKERRKPGDPWPVIIIDEANALSEWEDKRSLFALLKFFVYLTKEMQLAHGESTRLNHSRAHSRVRGGLMPVLAVILATSDTFLLQWLEKGRAGPHPLPLHLAPRVHLLARQLKHPHVLHHGALLHV